MATIIAHCPECGGTDIRQKNVAYAELRVTQWELDPDSEELWPADYDADEGADWDADDSCPESLYVCRHGAKNGERCTWEGPIFDLVIEQAPDDEED